MKQLALRLACPLLLATQIGFAQQQISPLFYGQNFWLTNNNKDVSNNQNEPYKPTFTTPSSGKVTTSRARLIRVGGCNYNSGSTVGTSGIPDCKPHNVGAMNVLDYIGYADMVRKIRALGAEPLISVPFSGNSANISSEAAIAAKIVETINVQQKLQAKYFIIANEPGLDYPGQGYDVTNSTTQALYAQNVANYIKAFAVAMKQVDPNIIIVGPELEGWWPTVNANLLDDPSSNTRSIKGMISINDDPTGIAVGKFFVDIYTFHVYPSSSSWQSVVDFPYGANQFTGFKYYVDQVKAQIAANYNRSATMKLAITEFNTNTESSSAGTSEITGPVVNLQNAQTSGFPASFLGGQWMAEMMALGLEKELAFMNVWSVEEGSNLGYLHNTSKEEKSTYFHYLWMAKYFDGTFYRTTNASLGTGPNSSPAGVKAFASKSANGIAVIILNQTSNNYQFKIDLNTSTPGNNSSGIHVTFNISGASGTYPSSGWNTTDMQGNTSLLLLFTCNGTLQEKHVMSQSAMYNAYNPTGVNSYAPSVTIINAYSIAGAVATPGCLINGSGGSATASGGSSYLWTSPNGVQYTSSSISNLKVPGQYQVAIAGSCGTSYTSALLQLNAPLVDAGPDQNMCSNSNAKPIGNANLPTGPTYLWSSNVTTGQNQKNTTVAPSATDNYTLKVTESGCDAYDEVMVVAGPGEVYISDSPHDVGDQPNNQTLNAINAFWMSNDIWIRNFNDNGLAHENPQSDGTTTNYVKVKLTNKGCSAVNGGNLSVYFTKATTGGSWPNDWNGTNSCSTGQCPNLPACNGLINTLTGLTIAGNTSVIQTLSWNNTPDPSTFNCLGGAGSHGHFCLAARFDSPSTNSPNDDPIMSGHQTYQDNNVAQKNVTIIDIDGPNMVIGNISLHNNTDVDMLRWAFMALPDVNGQTILDYATMRIHFSPEVLAKWINGGETGYGFTQIDDETIEITSASARMDNIFMDYEETQFAAIELTPCAEIPAAELGKYFEYQVQQYVNDDDALPTTGGVSYLIKKNPWSTDGCGGTGSRKKTETTSIIEDKDHATLLEVIPNPTSGHVSILCNTDNLNSCRLTIFDVSGKVIKCHQFEGDVNTAEFDFTNLDNGLYFIKVESEGAAYLKKLIIAK